MKRINNTKDLPWLPELQQVEVADLNIVPMAVADVPCDVLASQPGSRGFTAEVTEQDDTSWGFSPVWLLAILVSVPLVASLFWWLGSTFFASGLSFFEYHQFSVVITGVVAGGYQLYFWVQRNNQHLSAKCMKLAIDDWIPFWPRLVWCYSLLYFVMIGLTVISINDLAQGVQLIFGGLMLLSIGALIYYLYPTTVPQSFRDYEVNSLSTRYLAFIQSMDNDRNAFPSMHCAIATYIGLTVSSVPTIGLWLGYGNIVIIAISCVTVKQHVLIDTVAGIALGTAVFHTNSWLALLM
jgi:hypothetical protein